MVEFALILPVIIFLLLSIMEGGRILSAYLELQSLVKEGARYASIHCTADSISEGQLPLWVADTLTPWVKGRLASLESGRLGLVFQRDSVGSSEVWVDLTLSYSLNIVTPIISNLVGNPFAMSSRIVMRSE